jgi:hypothetical protein
MSRSAMGGAMSGCDVGLARFGTVQGTRCVQRGSGDCAKAGDKKSETKYRYA